MESSPYVDGTITLFKRLRAKSAKVGIAIQAYLFRTEKDIEELVALGFGDPPREGRLSRNRRPWRIRRSPTWTRTTSSWPRLLQDDNMRPGALLHIATHDIALQERLRR